MARKDKRPTKIYPARHPAEQPIGPEEEQPDDVVIPEPPEFPII